MEPDHLQAFIDDVASLVASIDAEYEITKRVAPRLSALLASGYRLPPEFIRPSPVRHLTYPLYIAPDDSWSLASVVWNMGQRTPVHGHETWDVVGIYSGAEREIRYVPTVGIHVYGGNIGTINRPSYDPSTGAVQWFVSGWDHPTVDGKPRESSHSKA